jgi:hypothetical protein
MLLRELINTDNKYIKFKNGSEINVIENNESVRGCSSQEIYYLNAIKKYRTLKGQIELIEKQVGKLNLYQKVRIIFWIKYYDIVNYFTNPYEISNKYIRKRGKRRNCGLYEDKANKCE